MASIAFANSVALQPSIGNATSNDTPLAIVKRDGSGNFAASTITSNLIGNVTGNVTGNAAALSGPVISQFIVDSNSPSITYPAIVSLNPSTGNVTLGFGQTVSSPYPSSTVGNGNNGNFLAALSPTQFVALYAPANSTNNVTGPATVTAGTLSGGVITWGTPVFASPSTTGGTTNSNNNPFWANIVALDSVTFAIVWGVAQPAQLSSWTIGQVGSSNSITIDPGVASFLSGQQLLLPNIMSMNFTNSTPNSVGGNLSGQIVITGKDATASSKPTAFIWTYSGAISSIVYTAGVAAGNLSSGPKYPATALTTSTGTHSVQLTTTTFLMFFDIVAAAPSVLSTLNIVVGTISGSGAGASISYGTATTTNPIGWHNWPVTSSSRINAVAAVLSSTSIIFNYLPTIRNGYSPNFGLHALVVQISSGTTVTLPVAAVSIAGFMVTQVDMSALPLSTTTYALGIVGSNGTNMMICTLSGTTITPGLIYPVGAGSNSVTIVSASAGQIVISVQSSRSILVAYQVNYVGTVFSVAPSQTGLRPVGIATTSATANGSITVQLFGIVSGLTGLIPGIDYYGFSDGSIQSQAYNVSYDYGSSLVLGPALTNSTLLLRWAS